MKSDEIAPKSDSLSLDILGDDNAPRVIYIVRYREVRSNAELRAIGISNFPGRTPGLPDDDPLWPPKP